MLYDALLVLALWMVTLLPMVAVAGELSGPVVRAVQFLELYGFFVYFWVSRGQTLGMLAWRLELHSDSGKRLTLTQATLRFLAALLSFVCLGLGYLWILIDPARRSWSDLASSSRVLIVPKTTG